MSTSKVIFTYKRKRLSSRSGVDHTDVCTNFSLDVQVDKQPDVPDNKVRSQEKDQMILSCINCTDVDLNSSLKSFDDQQTDLQLQDVRCEEKSAAVFPSVALHNSGQLDEKHNAKRSDKTCSRETIRGSDELLGDNSFKTSGENVSGGACLGEMIAVIEKDFCVHQSSSLDIKGLMNSGSVSQLSSNLISPLKQSSLCESKVAKGKSTAPLLTFSRRLKRKPGASGTGLFTELSLRERDTTIKECNSVLEPTCAHEVELKESRVVEKSVDMAVINSSVKMISGEIGNSSCPSRQSCAESPILRHNEVTGTSQEGMGVDISPSKETANSISGLISNYHSLDSLQKDEVNCSLNDKAVASCNISIKIDEQPVSQLLEASSGDSQLTSGGSSDLKQDSAKRMERSSRSNSLDLTRPPPDAFVIDCNVVPESDVQEASDIIQGSSADGESKIVKPEGQERHKKSKGLELFGDKILPVEDSSDGVHTSLPTEARHNTMYLQLFSDNGNFGQLTSSNTQFEISQSPQLAQSNNKAPSALGLSLPTEQRHEGQTSKDGPIIHQFQNPNVRICDLIQNPHVQPFTDPASLRHKLLLESINTRATSLQGNRNISLDNFDPSPAVWSEEELDSLWIGIRRYGRGHWRAMLLDPRLRFAPWRVAGELEEQWERELYKLFSGQHMPLNRYPSPQDAYNYNFHYQGAAFCPGTGSRREIMADTQLSLGDLYAQRDSLSFQGNAQKLVTMASCGPGGYGFIPINNVQASGMGRGEASPDGPAMAFGLPHWLRDPINAPRPLDLPLPLPPSSNLPPMGGVRLVNAFPGSSGTFCQGTNAPNNKFADANPSSSTKKPNMANVIVIDSDASSEETISDDNNVGS